MQELHRPIFINTVAFHDFDGDGAEEIVATASTCFTGTAGPDIHGVYRVLGDWQLESLPIQELDEFGGQRLHDHLRGNRNYFLYPLSTGELVAEVHDESSRPE